MKDLLFFVIVCAFACIVLFFIILIVYLKRARPHNCFGCKFYDCPSGYCRFHNAKPTDPMHSCIAAKFVNED